MKTPPRTQTARRTLHALHATNFLVLTATGLLIQFPDWRAALLGGYGPILSASHRWCGVVFGALPVALALWFGPSFLRDAWKRASRRKGRPVRRGNLIAAFVGAAGFVGTGVILWWDPPGAPRALFDVSLLIHQVLTYVGLAVLVAHLIWIRRLLWAKARFAIFPKPAAERPVRTSPVVQGSAVGGDPC
jgi:cytochrome b subunit of formate dehydrogenase